MQQRRSHPTLHPNGTIQSELDGTQLDLMSPGAPLISPTTFFPGDISKTKDLIFSSSFSSFSPPLEQHDKVITLKVALGPALHRIPLSHTAVYTPSWRLSAVDSSLGSVKSKTDHFKKIPQELLAEMLQFLPTTEVLRWASLVCRGWHNVTRRHPVLRSYAGLRGLHVIGSIPAPQSIGTSMPLPVMAHGRFHCAAAVVDRKIYVIGGRLTASSDRLATGTVCDPTAALPNWEVIPAMSQPRSGGAAVGHGGKLWVFGGTDGTRDIATVACYDPKTMMWCDEVVPPMPYPCSAVSATVLGRHILVIGGRQHTGQVLNVVRCLDMDTRKWTELAPLLVACAAPAVGVLNGAVWVAGGSDKARAPIASSEYFFEGTWYAGPNLKTPRSNPTGAVVAGKFRVLCGFCLGPLSSCEELDIADDGTALQWKMVKDLPRKFDAARAVAWE